MKGRLLLILGLLLSGERDIKCTDLIDLGEVLIVGEVTRFVDVCGREVMVSELRVRGVIMSQLRSISYLMLCNHTLISVLWVVSILDESLLD